MYPALDFLLRYFLRDVKEWFPMILIRYFSWDGIFYNKTKASYIIEVLVHLAKKKMHI